MECTKAARRVRDPGSAREPHRPASQPLQLALHPREMGDLRNWSLADHDLRPAFDDRSNEIGNTGGVILVVGIGVDDDVGAEPQRLLDPRHKGFREPVIIGETKDMVCPGGFRDLGGAVRRAVVDHQPLDAVEACDLARQRGQRLGQLLRLVEARDLDNQLHDFEDWLFLSEETTAVYPHSA